MSRPVTKLTVLPEPWSDKLLRVMLNIRLNRCCCVFTLRQGTLLIAAVELSLTSFILLLLVLGVNHAQEIISLTKADLRNMEDGLYWTGDTAIMDFPIETPAYPTTNNELKMHTGEQLATVMIMLLYTGVVLATIHLLSCLSLLYGALRSLSHFLLPWASTVLLSVVLGSLLLIILVFLPFDCKPRFYAFAAVALVLELYAWFVVFSFYRQLTSVVPTSRTMKEHTENIVVGRLMVKNKCPKIDI